MFVTSKFKLPTLYIVALLPIILYIKTVSNVKTRPQSACMSSINTKIVYTKIWKFYKQSRLR